MALMTRRCEYIVNATSSLSNANGLKSSVLQKHLYSQNAEIVESITHLSQPSAPVSSMGNYLLVPHTSSDDSIPNTPSSEIRPTVVTDMWVERCLHRKAYVSPQNNVTSTPFRHFPISGKLCTHHTIMENIDMF